MAASSRDMKRVAIIGAGAAGLCCARHFTRELKHFNIQVFEKSYVVGGTWMFSHETAPHSVHSSVYKNLRTNLPKEIMRFPDFPYPSHLPSFPGHRDILKYLQQYADHFDLTQYIRFRTLIEQVIPVPKEVDLERKSKRESFKLVGNRECNKYCSDPVLWRVTTQNLESGERTSEDFDAIVVCNGHYFKPCLPDIPGLSDFPGLVIHSHLYREPESYTDQNVLVVGAGPSGIDIILDLSPFSKHVYLSNRGSPLTTTIPSNIYKMPGISAVKKNGMVEFMNGQVIKVDSIILATGYIFSFPFLTECTGIKVVGGKRIKPLYKHTFNCSHPSMVFIGINSGVNPFPIFDYQVCWVKSVWSGEKALPSREEMIRDDEEVYQERLCHGLSPQKAGHHLGAAQWVFLDCLAVLGGKEPLLPVYQMIYEDVHKERKHGLMRYKDIDYHVLGKDKWIVVKVPPM